AHTRGIVHRDVKPGNLMLTLLGLVKVLDLGLARIDLLPAGGPPLTMSGTPLGTPSYMAPEQIEDAHGVDVKADSYALGCTLYHLLAGRPPFSGPAYKNWFQQLQAHLRERVPPL